MPVSPPPARILDEFLTVYRTAELQLIEALARATAKGAATEDLAAQAAEATRLRQRTEEIVRQLARRVATAAPKMMLEAVLYGGREAMADLDALVGGPGRDFDSVLNRASVENLARSLVDTLTPAHLSVTRVIDDAYKQVMGRAVIGVLTGTDTRREASQKALNEFARRGITGFTDKAGRRWELQTYAEMAARTATARAAVDAHVDQLQSEDIELGYISDSPQECPLCRPWEGKVVTLDAGLGGQRTMQVEHAIEDRMIGVKVAGSLAEARAAGLFHPNCTHSVSAFLPGVTELPTDTENAQGYEDRQKLRGLERGVRKAKRVQAAAFTPEAKKAAGRDVRAWEARIREHVGSSQAKRQPARERNMDGRADQAVPVPEGQAADIFRDEADRARRDAGTATRELEATARKQLEQTTDTARAEKERAAAEEAERKRQEKNARRREQRAARKAAEVAEKERREREAAEAAARAEQERIAAAEREAREAAEREAAEQAAREAAALPVTDVDEARVQTVVAAVDGAIQGVIDDLTDPRDLPDIIRESLLYNAMLRPETSDRVKTAVRTAVTTAYPDISGRDLASLEKIGLRAAIDRATPSDARQLVAGRGIALAVTALERKRAHGDRDLDTVVAEARRVIGDPRAFDPGGYNSAAADGGPTSEMITKLDAVRAVGAAVSREVEKRMLARRTQLVQMSPYARAVQVANIRRQVLSEIREMGSGRNGEAVMHSFRDGFADEDQKFRIGEMLERATNSYPRDWISQLERVLPYGGVKVHRASNRGYFSPASMVLEVGTHDDDARQEHTVVHELGHGMETGSPHLKVAEWAYLRMRVTAGGDVGSRTFDKRTVISTPKNGAPEIGYKDDFENHYTGRVYGDQGKKQPFELLTTGVESIFAGGRANYLDPDFEQFILGTLAVL